MSVMRDSWEISYLSSSLSFGVSRRVATADQILVLMFSTVNICSNGITLRCTSFKMTDKCLKI